ncbi:MAG: hypothetical protein RMK57_11165 [Bryobacterales bacterium]|nr:hypothetical protein [Bryobacteraceae bacterium]MDW8355079.1 hypothetical protein [Bryobacterales bacterium]
MARKTASASRNGSMLEQAMTLLINNQAEFVAQLGRMQERFAHMDERFARIDERFARIDERFARIDERFARIDERFAHIEAELSAIKAILLRHERMLEALPEAVRQKIGFNPA